MKSGEVAIENSVNAFRELKSGKLKDRAVSAQYLHYDNRRHHLHHRHSMPQQQYTAQYPPQPYPPFQPIQYQAPALLPLYAQRVQPVVPLYHRYSSAGNTSSFTAPVPPHRPPKDHSGAKPSLRAEGIQPPQPPPAPAPAPAPAPTPIEASKQAVCFKYTSRGGCHHGASCRFSHDHQAVEASQRGFIGRSYQQFWSAPGALNDPIHGNFHESHFPSLSADARKSAAENRSSRSNDNQSPERGSESPPQKNLVFRDAVLKHQRKVADSVIPERKSPSRSTTSSDGGVSDQEDTCTTGNQSSGQDHGEELTTKIDQGRIQSDTVLAGDDHHEDIRRIRDPPQPVDSTPQASNGKPFRSRVVEPEPGQTGYPVYPVYPTTRTYASDDTAAYSALSRDAHCFVHRIDSKLRSLACHQQKALSKLQDLVHNLWPDSTIDVYGSNFTRLALPRSDVDCVLSSTSTEEPAEMLRKLANGLEQQSWAKSVELLGSAKIPVLKIVYCSSGKSKSEVKLDLTCAHSPGHSGLSARTLIYSHQVEMPALRPLVLILKSHIQRHGLNIAFTGGLSSYGLVLLVIRFLQACGDEHHVADNPADLENTRDTGRGRSTSENSVLSVLGNQRRSDGGRSPLVYDFTRGGKLTWRTGLGNLLLLFLETYVTFDYRRFGISTSNAGEYFPLPVEKMLLEPGAVVTPYIVDPIKPTRSIGSCFRMHEIIQAWYSFYQLLVAGASIRDAMKQPTQASSMV